MIETYIKNNKHILDFDGVNKIELSNPYVRFFGGSEVGEGPDILNFYYDIKLSYRDKFKDEKWKKLIKGKVRSFHMIHILSRVIDKLLKMDVEKEGIKEEFSDNVFEGYTCTYVDSYYTPDNEETYTLYKIMRVEHGKSVVYYRFEYGVCCCSDAGVVKFSWDKLSEEDMLMIKEWAEGFVHYSTTERAELSVRGKVVKYSVPDYKYEGKNIKFGNSSYM